MPRDSVEGSRGAVIERLRDMGRQMSTIDQMAANIERDFHSTRLVNSVALSIMLSLLKSLSNLNMSEVIETTCMYQVHQELLFLWGQDEINNKMFKILFV